MIKVDLVDDDRYFFEHANIQARDIKQPFDIWVDEIGKDRNVKHKEPRFKVKANNVELDIILHNNGDIETVNDKRDIKKFKYHREAVEFIDKFKEPLRAHWNHDVTTYELIKILRKTYKTDAEILDVLTDVINNGIPEEQ